MSFNKVILVGNLTRDVESRAAGSTTVAGFGLAVNRKWKDASGEGKEEVAFIDCKAWGKTGDAIAKFFGKGKPILVEGRLTMEEWKDKESGANRTKLLVTVESFSFIGGDKPAEKPATKSYNQPKAVPEVADSDIPF